MHHLSIDIETFSPVPIGKAGLYKYVQSPDFQIMLLAWSLNGSPVQIIDLMKPEPVSPELWSALWDPGTVKHAFNAAFEWYSLSKWARVADPASWLPQWRCTMLHSLYCGFPASLKDAGAALGLPSSKQKDRNGQALIRYFCVPCKPTNANGGRIRNMPRHAPDRWKLFKEYCRQDVVSEMEIERRLSQWPVPDDVQKQWMQDQIINSRGVALDMGLIDGALAIDAAKTGDLQSEARLLTGLENPNSGKQLMGWLESRGAGLENLQKQTVEDALENPDMPPDVRRVLEIRLGTSKASTKKYVAMKNAVCDDGRVRGLLRFYGANRTGRWSGKIIQPQNLPRTYIDKQLIPLTRELTRDGNGDALQKLYGSTQSTLSQLIRTAFVPSSGNVFVDADFSAIEARVIAWLSGEQWRLDVFRTHGKIYEASASQMFGVPLERIRKGNPEYALRQKGKVAELALGYNGGSGALIAMGALRMGLTEEELPDIVKRWRGSNRCIVRMWHEVENAALETLRTGRASCAGKCGFALESDGGLYFLTIALPSGRKLFYARPFLTQNRFGSESIGYYGINQQTKKWREIETYGGKLVENITQAVARDCLALNIERLEAAGFPIVFHVHDEVVIDIEKERADLEAVTKIMSRPPEWAKGLPLNADGWVGEYFTKD